MGIRYTHFFDEFQALVDSLMHDSDETQRLANVHRLYQEATKLLHRAREQAAYDLRVKYSTGDAAALSGVHKDYLNRWANNYRVKNGLPSLKRRQSIDLSNVIDLSGSAASPQTPPLRSSESVPSSER